MEFVGVVGGVGTTVEIMGDMSTSCHETLSASLVIYTGQLLNKQLSNW